MKKLINTIKNFYHQDPEGLIGSIAITLFFYFLLFHLIPIIKP
jgi:succinate dehydrogenase/fumarate reductase cytochrome b subunit